MRLLQRRLGGNGENAEHLLFYELGTGAIYQRFKDGPQTQQRRIDLIGLCLM